MKYVATASRGIIEYGAIKRILSSVDTKKAVIGMETGRSGYQHFQMCIDCSGDLERYNLQNSLGWHIENCISWERAILYCRKEGKYHDIGFRDTRWLHRRYLPIHETVLKHLDIEDDRRITVWINTSGKAGKSSLLYNLARSGRVLPIPRSDQSAGGLNDFVAMMYEDEEIICLDLPRNAKLTPKQAEVLESCKDGLFVSAKYEGKVKLGKGVKVLVLTNHELPKETYEALTEDRWDIIRS